MACGIGFVQSHGLLVRGKLLGAIEMDKEEAKMLLSKLSNKGAQNVAESAEVVRDFLMIELDYPNTVVIDFLGAICDAWNEMD